MIYYLEYLLGMYCATDDEESINEGVDRAKKILLSMSNAIDLPTVPPELFAKFQTSFYTSAEDAVFKALGVD